MWTELYMTYTFSSNISKKHKNQNILLEVYTFSNFFFQKHYRKVISDLQEMKCPSIWEPNKFFHETSFKQLCHIS